MPTYVYEVILDNGEGGEQFEVVQRMSEPPLERHPETGQPVRRVITPPHIAGKFTDRALNKTLKDDRKLGQLGFTKYERAADGRFEKRAGKGPGSISAD